MKRVLPFWVVTILVFSLQSCVSNYVASAPSKYKTDATLNKMNPNNLTASNKSVYGKSFNANFDKAQKSMLAAAISGAISYEQTIDGILNEAATYLGTPYRYGGSTRSGIDCSAFVLNVFGDTVGIELPRVASDQADVGEAVDKQQLLKGDLIFFSNGWGISHVGIVQEITADGDIRFIHAATSKGVMISSLNDAYWGRKYRFAKRIISQEQEITN